MRKPIISIGVLLLILLSTGSLFAQVAGRLSGSVVDQSGASVPGAAVNIYIRGGKEPVLTGKTNEAGIFSFMAMRPDAYDVGVEAAGFAKVTLRDVKVAPGQEVGLAPIKLEVQTAATTVEVSADVVSVQLANNEISSTVTSTQVQNLPVLGRQITNLLRTQPGVDAGSNTTTVNGLRSSFSNVTLDGVNIQDNFIRTNDLDYAPMRTTMDQIAEITVSTSNASAALGGGASQMVLSTKSGGNNYFGSVYWYNRNSFLGANNWFNNKSGTARSSINLNQPGAAVGGRIIRDKLFFYTNVELYRNKAQSSRLRTVLTDSAKNGIFTYKDTGNNIKTVALSSLRSYTADPRTKAMIADLPAPNTTDAGDGLNTSGYRFNARSNEFRDQVVFKSDYYLSSKHSFTGTYNYINNPTDRPDQGAFYTMVPPVSNTIKNHLLSVAWRWTASPTLTNEARFGFMRADTAFLNSNEYPKSIVGGLLFSSPVNTFMNQGRKVGTYTIQDNATWLKGTHEFSFGYQSQLLRISPFNDAGMIPTYNLGMSTANTLAFTSAQFPGIRSTDVTTANNLLSNLAGIISNANQTFNVTSTTSGFVPGATNLREFTYDTYAGYFQDKWRARKGLTLSFGVRYEYWTPLDEKNSLFLLPKLENNDVRATLMNPNAVLDFAGKSVGRPFYNADKNNFAPNVGFAWDPFGSGKTSVRGGYMIAFVNDNAVTAIRNNVNTASGLQFANTLSNLTSYLTSAPTIPTPAYKVPRTLADNYAVTTTSAAGLPDPNLVTPYVHQWSFGIQREFKGAIINARYVGNRGSKLLRAFDYNQVLYNANSFLGDFLRAQSNAVLAQARTGSYNGAYNASIPGSQQLSVFPLLTNGGNFTNGTVQTYLRQGEVGELANTYQVNRWNGPMSFYTNPNLQGANTIANTGFSNYHAAQFDVVKRTRAGLQMQFNYTYSKGLGNTSGDLQTNFEPMLDNNNPALENARTPFDLRHVFKANYYYELPFGHGKRWSGNRVLMAVFGDWAFSGIWSFQSGSPYSILSGLGTLNRAARSAAANTASIAGTSGETLAPLTSGVFMTGNGPYFLSPSIIGADGRGAATFGSAPFSGQLFYNPAPGAVGNLQRRMFSGPWQWSWDISFKKGIRIAERQTLDLHCDLFNWMNHPTFYVPPSAGDYGSQTNFTVNNTTFGKITGMNYASRIVQLGVYYRFGQ